MNDLEFVDTHVHLWDLDNEKVSYDWLKPGVEESRYGPDFQDLKKDYLAGNFLSDSVDANVTKVVHVQAALGTADPVEETAWIQSEFERTGIPQAAVVYSDLSLPSAENELKRHLEYPVTRGVRDFYAADKLDDPSYQIGFSLLEKYGLVACMNVKAQHMKAVLSISRKFPSIPIVIDHCGLPEKRTSDYFQLWQSAMKLASKAENVFCKISGLGMSDWTWTTDSIKPWILACIETFGPDRCMFGTNWPVDRLYSTYETLVEAYIEIISELNHDEQISMFSLNAERLYKI